MILVDHQIRRMCMENPHVEAGQSIFCKEPMIEPFVDYGDRPGVLSYGLSSHGYDLRLGNHAKVFKNSHGVIVNPKRFKDPEYVKLVLDDLYSEEKFLIPAGGYILGSSMEYLRIPDWVMAQCFGKSTLARAGITVNITPLECGWHGNLTVEIENANPCPVEVFVGEGIAQLVFHVLAGIPERTYAQKGGIYMGQQGVTVARVREVP